MQSRMFRKSRKMRKQKKTRRGGAVMIQYTVSGMNINTQHPLQFNSSSKNMNMLKGIFITELNGHKDPEPEDYDTLTENVAIHLISGQNDTVVYQGKMAEWGNDVMITFISSLNAGDRLRIELIA